MEEKKKLYLVDDHVVIRNAMAKYIEALGPYEVIAEMDNGRQLVNSFPLTTKPDLILLDYEMPEMNGLDVMSWFHENRIDIPVLILTHNEDEKLMIRLFRLGVRGYLHKNSRKETMIEALEEIFTKDYYHNDFLTRALKTESEETTQPHQQSVADMLSDKEKRFLTLVCDEEEYTYVQIADIMDVHRRTVDNYKQGICDKFGIRSKTGLVLFAIKNNIIELGK